jgi:hypothetical protein
MERAMWSWCLCRRACRFSMIRCLDRTELSRQLSQASCAVSTILRISFLVGSGTRVKTRWVEGSHTSMKRLLSDSTNSPESSL